MIMMQSPMQSRMQPPMQSLKQSLMWSLKQSLMWSLRSYAWSPDMRKAPGPFETCPPTH